MDELPHDGCVHCGLQIFKAVDGDWYHVDSKKEFCPFGLTPEGSLAESVKDYNARIQEENARI